MPIDTQSHFKRFYRQHQTTIDTLLLMAQLLATAIAVMFLLSLLGWAAAISYASDWCDRLVESSLDPTSWQDELTSSPHLGQTESGVSMQTAVVPDSPNVDMLDLDASVLIPSKPTIAFRSLKKKAAKKGIKGYQHMQKEDLIAALRT